MRKRSWICIGMFFVMMFPGILLAQPGAGEGSAEAPPKMGDVVVTATRLEESVNSVPANVTVVTEDDIANSTARDVADLMRTVPGVHVSDITGGRRTYRVDLRGFGETAELNTLLLVDGRRINEADLSATDWAQIPLDRVERIEIIRGGRASVLYGDNAAGGVINIITKKGDKFRTGGEVQAGSYATYKANAFVSGSRDEFSYAFSGSYYDTDGYRDNSQNEMKDLGADLGYVVSDMLAVNLSSGYHKDKAGLPGALKETDFAAGADRTDTVNPGNYADVEDYYVKGGPEVYFLTNSMIKLDLSYRNRDTGSFATFAGGYFDGEYGIKTVTASPQAIIREKVFGFDNNLNVGFDYTDVKEDVTNTSEYFGYLSSGVFNMERKSQGYYFHDAFDLSDVWSLSGGYRYDKASYDYNYVYSDGSAGSDSNDLEESLYTAGINYKLSPKSNAYFNYARSFRYPVLDEAFSFFTNSIVSSLKPQTASDYEMGIRYAFSDTLKIGINLFHIKTEDEIFYNPDSYSNMNLDGDTTRRGIELTADRSFGWGRLSVDYTYTKAEIDGGTYDGSEIPNVPQHQAGFNAFVDFWKPITFVVNGRYVGKRYFISDWTNTFSEQDDYFVMNGKVKYTWKNATAFIDINNLFNTEYSEYGVLGGYPLEKAYYPSPKMNFLVGISLAL